ncbi:MAG: GntR family transcriptional regulator [Bryobacteraceae bacterium]|nr:GntR family transcriptional regulator [Bryobacteraceae bacterium]
MTALPKIRQERAMDTVHEALRQAILSSSLRPGERLNPGDLAAQLGVSLMPVRHAIQLLAAEGLVEVRPRSGTFVASVSAKEVRETFEIRCALECLAVEKAVSNFSLADRKEMRRLCNAMSRVPRSEAEHRRHEQNNADFHRLFLEAAGNAKLLEMYASLRAHIQIAGVHAGDVDWRTRVTQEAAEHEAIVAAVEARDAAAAVEAMRRHITRSCESLARAVETKNGHAN